MRSSEIIFSMVGILGLVRATSFFADPRTA